jgi:hypothetical protein
VFTVEEVGGADAWDSEVRNGQYGNIEERHLAWTEGICRDCLGVMPELSTEDKWSGKSRKKRQCYMVTASSPSRSSSFRVS